MSHDMQVRLISCGMVGLASQITIYAMYASPVAFYLDGFTTSLIQMVVASVVLGLMYRPFFHCPTSNMNTVHLLLSMTLVASFFVLTTARLPAPLWPIVFCLVAGVETLRKRMLVVRTLVAIAVFAGSTLLTIDVVDVTRIGDVFYGEKNSESAFVVTYSLAGSLFTVSVFMLERYREERLHTARVVRNGFFLGTIAIAFLWGMSWIGPLGGTRIRVGPANVAEQTGIFFYVVFAVLPKILTLATLVEFVKLGQLFNYLVLSALAFLVFPMVASSGTDAPPRNTIIGIVMVIVAFCVSLLSMCCTQNAFAPTIRDMTCRVCRENKQWMGCMWSPITWWPQGGRTEGTRKDCGRHDTDEDDEESSVFHPVEIHGHTALGSTPMQSLFAIDDPNDHEPYTAMPRIAPPRLQRKDSRSQLSLDTPAHTTHLTIDPSE